MKHRFTILAAIILAGLLLFSACASSPSGPVPSEQAPSEPATSEPATSEPVPSEPVPSQPADTDNGATPTGEPPSGQNSMDEGDAAPAAEPEKTPTEKPAEEPSPKPTEKPAPDPTQAPAEGGVDPDAVLGSFKTQDIYGKKVTASVWEDYKLTMVNVWATFCGYCINEMPDLAEISGEYASKGVQVLGIVMDVYNSDGSLNDDQVARAQQIAEATGAGYTHILPTNGIYNAALTGVRGYPTTFFVDGKGNLVGDYYAGARSKSQFTSILDDMLEEINR